MNQRNFNRITASVFAGVAAAHALRLAFHKPVRLGEWNAPEWVSGAAVLAAGFLATNGAWLSRDRASEDGAPAEEAGS